MSAVVPEGERRAGRVVLGCSACGAAWLGSEGEDCALCGEGRLGPHSARVEGEPELALPFQLELDEARERLREYVGRHPMPVSGAVSAGGRLVAHYVPMWWVDARVVAAWQADIGFDYEVQSTVEKLSGGQWRSVPVTDSRIRWEPRAGTLDRWFDNVPAPALSTWEAWSDFLGEPERRRAVAVEPELPILLPDLPPEAAWPGAEQGFRRAVGAEIERACRGQHLRDLYLKAEWEDLRWTWLLFPVYSAWYTDPSGRVRVLRVDGSTGAVRGEVASSPGKAWFRAMLWGVLGLVLLAMSALVALPGIFLWPLLLLTALGAVLGFLCVGGAMLPILRVWRRNSGLAERDGLIE